MMLKNSTLCVVVIVLYTGALQADEGVDKDNDETTDSLFKQLSECGLLPHLGTAEISGMSLSLVPRLSFAKILSYWGGVTP